MTDSREGEVTTILAKETEIPPYGSASIHEKKIVGTSMPSPQYSSPEEDPHVVTSSFLLEGSAADLWLYQVRKTAPLFTDVDPRNLPDVVSVVKKVMRVAPDHFHNIEGRRDEDLLYNLRKGFYDRFQLWRSFNHPNLVTVYLVESRELALFQGYCESSDLREYLRKELSEIEYISVVRDILRGIVYLHSQDPPVAHGNINPSKIYMENGRAKLGEFGLSQSVAGFSHLVPSIKVTGMTRWMSPEYFDDSHPGIVTIPGDMWAFGCTLLEIVTGLMPYHQSNRDTQVLAKILGGVKPGDARSEQYINGADLSREYIRLTQSFIAQCWLPAEHRPSSRALLEKVEALKTSEPRQINHADRFRYPSATLKNPFNDPKQTWGLDFQRLPSLNNRIQRHPYKHVNPKCYQCPYCTQKFTSRDQVAVHTAAYHTVVKNGRTTAQGVLDIP